MLRFFLLFAVVAVGAGCDSAPGPDEAIGNPPSITGFSLTPTSDSLETAAAVAEIPVTLTATTAGGGGEATLLYTVRYRSTDSLVIQGEMTGESGQYEATPTLQIPRGAIGEYAITVASAAGDGSEGDRASGLFVFETFNLGPPEVDIVNVPSSVDRGDEFSITAEVTDPDGRENIAQVALFLEEALVGFMRDEGQSGDQVAGDGTYSVSLAVPPDGETGDVELGILAIDRFGGESDLTVFTISIQ